MGEASSVTRAGAANQHKPDDNPLAGETELGLLRRWLDENPSDALGWSFLQALVVESIKKVSFSDVNRRFTDDELDQPAQAWFAAKRWWESRERDFEAWLRKEGATELPYPSRTSGPGGKGNRATTVLRVRPIEAPIVDADGEGEARDPNLVRYVRDTERPVTLAGPIRRRLFRDGGIRLGTWRDHAILWRAYTPMTLVILVGTVALISMLGDGRPVLGRDLVMLVLIPAFAWSWWDSWKPLGYARRYRITALPAEWLAKGTPPAQLERRRTPEGEVLEVVRYEAVCPICGSTLQLADGAPERPGRTVGRCIDAPREHVFSYDPVSHEGSRLT